MELEEIQAFANRFLEGKFGKNMSLKYSGHQNTSQFEGERVGGDLNEILVEFASIITATELSELQNPRTKSFTLIDKSKGIIIGSYQGPVLTDR